MALKYSGTTITSTTAVRVGNRGQRFAIQPDVAVYVAVGSSTIEASTANGVLVSAGGFYEDTIEGDGNEYVSVYSAAAFNAKLFKGALV